MSSSLEMDEAVSSPTSGITTTHWIGKTEYFSDAVEWCPIDSNQDLLVCGQYQLSSTQHEVNEETSPPQSRVGGLDLYQLNQTEGSSYECTLLQNIRCHGVLDVKWCPCVVEGNCLLGVALSSGSVQLMKLNNNDENGSRKLEQCSSIDFQQSCDVLALSLDWSSRIQTEPPYHIVVSDSSGFISLLVILDGKLELVKKWKAHSFESWIAAFDYHNPYIIYSGGDDCLFLGWDTRSSLDKPTFCSKSHTMGVTSIQKSKEEYVLATGSYDENILLWDTRKMSRPVSNITTGGGVWRLKWHPYLRDKLLAACMHNGFQIVNTKGEGTTIATYDKHSSLAYGVDWCHQVIEKSISDIIPSSDLEKPLGCNNYLISSCSFYDCSLHVWDVEL